MLLYSSYTISTDGNTIASLCQNVIKQHSRAPLAPSVDRQFGYGGGAGYNSGLVLLLPSHARVDRRWLAPVGACAKGHKECAAASAARQHHAGAGAREYAWGPRPTSGPWPTGPARECCCGRYAVTADTAATASDDAATTTASDDADDARYNDPTRSPGQSTDFPAANRNYASAKRRRAEPGGCDLGTRQINHNICLHSALDNSVFSGSDRPLASPRPPSAERVSQLPPEQPEGAIDRWAVVQRRQREHGIESDSGRNHLPPNGAGGGGPPLNYAASLASTINSRHGKEQEGVKGGTEVPYIDLH